MQILPFSTSHIDAVVELTREFDEYLQSLSNIKREEFDTERQRAKFIKYWFGEE